MKLLFEILLSIVLHPIAMILMWINLIGRGDLSTLQKAIWFVVSIVWGRELPPGVRAIIGEHAFV